MHLFFLKKKRTISIQLSWMNANQKSKRSGHNKLNPLGVFRNIYED